MTSTSLQPKPKFPCPKCCNYCDSDTNRISCDQCSNFFHLQCTKFTKKHFIMMKRNGAKFICEICNSKTHCDQCKINVSSCLKGIYCVNCLEFSCMGCVPLSNSEVHKFLTTKQPYFCNQCSECFYCPVCGKLCEDTGPNLGFELRYRWFKKWVIYPKFTSFYPKFSRFYPKLSHLIPNSAILSQIKLFYLTFRRFIPKSAVFIHKFSYFIPNLSF